MSDALRNVLNLPPADQVGLVVQDLEQSMKRYDPLFGPFSVMEPGEMTYDYRGRQEPCTIRIAYGRSGDLEIELIEWVAGGCPHKEFLDAGREGMHHLRFIVEDLDASLVQAAGLGYSPVWQTRFGEGLAVAYLERADDPLLIELFENHGLAD